jgi:hypothetical protein
MKSKVLSYVFFILYVSGQYELVTCESLEDLADVVIQSFDEIEGIYEIDCF